jgi:hypothetical protein
MTPDEYQATIADARKKSEPHRQLRAAVGDVRLVGGLFVLLGSLPMFLAVFNLSRDSWGARLLAIVNTLVLLGPGVWYFAAGTMMRRMNRPALRQAIWVARMQLAIVPITLLLGIFARPVGYDPSIFLVPVVLTVFFIPALIALLFSFRRIGGLMEQIEPEGRGFEAMPVQAMSVPQQQQPPPLPQQRQPIQSRDV